MQASPLDKAVLLTDLAATRDSGAAMRAEALAVGLLALRTARAPRPGVVRDEHVARLLGPLGGYGQLLAVAEVAPRVLAGQAEERLRRITASDLREGARFVRALVVGDDVTVRSLAPRDRRADVREDRALLLAASAFRVLELIADGHLLARAIKKEARMARMAEDAEWRALISRIWAP